MAEEQQKWQEASTHVLCANNCGFFGSPTTLNLCSKCYKDHSIKDRQISTPKISVEHNLSESSSFPVKISGEGKVTSPRHQSESILPESGSKGSDLVGNDVHAPQNEIHAPLNELYAPVSEVHAHIGEVRKPVVRNRCGSCKKRVGLTGFTCKCGTLFCGTHRYPEKHECSFDFKTVGKEAIKRENPVVKASKLDKI